VIRLAHKLQPWPGRTDDLAGAAPPAGAATIEG
jgi:hypothetical protein